MHAYMEPMTLHVYLIIYIPVHLYMHTHPYIHTSVPYLRGNYINPIKRSLFGVTLTKIHITSNETTQNGA